MAEMRERLDAPILVGVGAAFDFHAGPGAPGARLDAERWAWSGPIASRTSRGGCGGATRATTRASSPASSGSTSRAPRRPPRRPGALAPAPGPRERVELASSGRPPTRVMDHDVSIVGLGRVGLPLALSFADRGLRVLGVDNDPERLDSVRSGQMPFAETGTQELLERVLARPADAVRARGRRGAPPRDIVITLGTPSFSHIEIDMRDIRSALDDLLPVLREGTRSCCARRSPRARPSSWPATWPSTAASRSAPTCSSPTPPSASPPGASWRRSARCRASSAASASARARSRRALFEGLRRADRADHAGPGRAGEDLDQHPALRHLRPAQPADDGLRAARRERVRGDRPDQPRLPARRHRAARA